MKFNFSEKKKNGITNLLGLAGGCQRQNIVRMCSVPVSQTKGTSGDLAEGTIEAHRLGVVIGAEWGAIVAAEAPWAPLNAVRLPDASWWAQIVRRQWASLGMTRIPARVTVQYLKSQQNVFLNICLICSSCSWLIIILLFIFGLIGNLQLLR